MTRGISLRLAKTEEHDTFETGGVELVSQEEYGPRRGPVDLHQNSELLPQDNLGLRKFGVEASMYHLAPK